MPIRLALVGLGKIAQNQHIPALLASPDFELVCGATLQGTCPRGVTYSSVEQMLGAEPGIEAVVLCQPPQARFQAAQLALAAGKHLFLEKPPAANLGEVAILDGMARERGLTLFAAWHSRYAPAVEPARAWLSDRRVLSARISWREDVRVWHPGQEWIWRPGGLGVFDPGVNALSIATHILPEMRVAEATMSFPANRETPIAAQMRLTLEDGVSIDAEFDFRQTGQQTWMIVVETAGGLLELHDGGAAMSIDGARQPLPATAEYPALYARFAALVGQGRSDVDVRPLQLVADAFLCGTRRIVEAFFDPP